LWTAAESGIRRVHPLPFYLLLDINDIGLGLASHLGVLLGITTIGIAKNLLYLPDIPPTLTYDSIRTEMDIAKPYYAVHGESGTLYGAAVIPRDTEHVERPIYVSVGNMIELDTAVELVHATSRFRIPEAIRAADGGSRDVLRLLEEKRLHENNV
jgi:deoxyinosine 3'endonuclease (endonuclease V)